MGGQGTGCRMLVCHSQGMWLWGSEESALGREWMDSVLWGSALLGGEGLWMQLGLRVLVLGWGGGCLKRFKCIGLLCFLVLQ